MEKGYFPEGILLKGPSSLIIKFDFALETIFPQNSIIKEKPF
jgi:hypothetical protein